MTRLTLGALLGLMAASGADLQLSDGTAVLLSLNQSLSPKSARLGSTVGFVVVEDVRLNGLVVIRKGATASGIINDPKALQKFEKDSDPLGVRLQHVEMVNGAKAPLREERPVDQESGTGAKVLGGVGATSKTIGKISTGGLLFKGRKRSDPIPAGLLVRASVNGAVLLDPADFQSEAKAPEPAPGSAGPATPVTPTGRRLTNQDVLTLLSRGFSDDLLIAKIKNSATDFNTDPDELIGLKKAGVPEGVIRAMIEAGAARKP